MAARSLACALLLAAGVCALQIPVLIWSEETLAAQSRQPFTLAKADPLKNLGILFRGGHDLRMMTASRLLTDCCNGVHATMPAFQIGTLGWTAGRQSYHGSLQSGLGIVSQGALAVPMIRRFGAKRAYELGGHCSTASLLLLSQCHRPANARSLQWTVQLLLACPRPPGAVKRP